MGQNNGILLSSIALVSLSLGFWAGTRKSHRTERSPPTAPSLENSTAQDGNESDDSDSSIVEDGVSSLRADALDTCKMVFVVRTDLGMSSGKFAAQCSHAALACYKTLLTQNPAMLRQWERAGQTKVALQCADEDELLRLQAHAASLSLCARTIQDAGRTQIAAGSRTALGIAGPTKLINLVTGRLRLL